MPDKKIIPDVNYNQMLHVHAISGHAFLMSEQIAPVQCAVSLSCAVQPAKQLTNKPCRWLCTSPTSSFQTRDNHVSSFVHLSLPTGGGVEPRGAARWPHTPSPASTYPEPAACVVPPSLPPPVLLIGDNQVSYCQKAARAIPLDTVIYKISFRYVLTNAYTPTATRR